MKHKFLIVFNRLHKLSMNLIESVQINPKKQVLCEVF